MKVNLIVMEAKPYSIFVIAMVLYPMGITLDFWEEMTLYRPR